MRARTPSATLALSVVLLASQPASAQQALAVLPVDYGGTTDAEAGQVQLVLAARAGYTVLREEAVNAALEARYAQPVGVDPAWVAEQAEAAETAYYEMRYDDSVDMLSTTEWQQAKQAVVDMAYDPSLAQAVRTGLMSRARAQYYGGRPEAADGTIRDTVRIFPGWVPTTDWYQPEFIARYVEVRNALLSNAQQLTVETPDPSCIASINGEEVGAGHEVSVAVPDGTYAVQVTCGRSASLTHRIVVDGVERIRIDPAFDAAYDSGERVLRAARPGPDDLVSLARCGAAYADLVNVREVALAGITAGDELQILMVDRTSAAVSSGVRASRGGDGSFPVASAVAAMRDAVPTEGMQVWIEGDWLSPGVEGRPSIGPYILLGAGGAVLIVGGVFAIIENGTFGDFEACRDDPGCAGTTRLDDLRSDSETQSLLATLGVSIGAAAVIGGVIWLILDRRDPESAPVDGGDDSAAWIPRVTGAAAPGGGAVGLGWTF